MAFGRGDFAEALGGEFQECVKAGVFDGDGHRWFGYCALDPGGLQDSEASFQIEYMCDIYRIWARETHLRHAPDLTGMSRMSKRTGSATV